MRRWLTHTLERHLQGSIGTLGQFSRAPFQSLITCLLIGIALAFPMAFHMMLKNLESLSGHFQQSLQLTLFLKDSANEAEALSLSEELKKEALVKKIAVISPALGLQTLEKTANFAFPLKELSENPLPWVITITPHAHISDETLEAFTQKLRSFPLLDSFQMDTLWVKRLDAFLQLAERGIRILAVFLAIAVWLIIYHAIRGATSNNTKEIKIIQWIGGTNAFIRRPFLYAGFLYGLLGALLAWQLVDAFFLSLQQPAKQLITLYQSQFTLHSLGLRETFELLGSGALLGITSAWIAVHKHLKSQY